MENGGPVEISGTAETLPNDCYVTAAYGYDVKFKYANGSTINVVNDTVKIRFEGTNGWLQCSDWNGKLEASDRNWLHNKTLDEHPDFWPRPEPEWPNFLAKIKDPSKPLTYGAEAGHRLASILHLGNLTLKGSATVKWDPLTEKFTQNATQMEANKVFQRVERNWSEGL